MGMMGGASQGTEIDLLRIYVDSNAKENKTVPTALSPVIDYSPAQAKRTRIFNLAMSGMVHTING
jgi:hypothetical protein